MTIDYFAIGKRIKGVRQERKKSQEVFAEELNISTTFLSKIERGIDKISLNRLIQISDALNVSPGYLINGSNIESRNPLKEEFSLLLDKCTPKQQKTIYKISKSIIEFNSEK